MPFAIFILITLAALTLFSGGYTFFAACVRRKELPWLVEDELLKTPYGKYYENICWADAYLKDHNAQEVTVSSYDRLKLSGTWLPADNPKGTIILAHGYRSCKLVEFSMVLDFYRSHSLNLLLIDQRAHGKSQGQLITFGVKESRDLETWVHWHNEKIGEYPLILSGLSMGASTVLYLADKNLPKNVKGIIADCGFTSPWEIISSVFRRVTHLPAVPSLWVADICARVFGGFSLREMDTRKILPNNKIPLLIIHGTADDFVPCDMSRQAYAVCAGDKDLFLVEGAEHGLSFLVDTERYKEKVVAFLNKHLGVQE